LVDGLLFREALKQGVEKVVQASSSPQRRCFLRTQMDVLGKYMVEKERNG
jgi:hypothetical protein